MPEIKEKRKTSAPKPAIEKQDLSPDQVEEVMFPELSKDKFHLGDQVFRIRVMPYKFETMFRKATMPILESELKPIEKAIVAFTTDQALYQGDMRITEAITKSELDADIFLINAMIVICLSQDAEFVAAASSGVEFPADAQMKIELRYRKLLEYSENLGPSPRNYFREVIRKQADKHQMVQILGESLMARCAEVSSLMGKRHEFDSRKQDFSRQAQKFLEKAGKAVGPLASLFSPSTETGPETNQPAEPLKIPAATQVAEPEAAAPEVETSAPVQ